MDNNKKISNMEKDTLEFVLNEYRKEQKEQTISIQELVKPINDFIGRFDTLGQRPEKEEQLDYFRRELSEELQKHLRPLKHQLGNIPEKIPIHFDLRSREFIIGGISLLIATAIAVGLCFGYGAENKRLYENDLKFRMIRQRVPSVAIWADTTYHHNPEFAKKQTDKMEASEKARQQAEIIAKQKESDAKRQVKEAKQARKEADRLKR
jgi:hypothetical protein